MAYANWDEVIVQWVNCLNIANPIDNIEDCKDSDFFKKFLQTLNDKIVITKEEDVVEIIHGLLQHVFINFKFTKNPIGQLSRDEIIELCLLSMYYACIIEQNEVLISPLCHRLPQKTQLCIRKFLESMTYQVTSVSLQDIANECIKPFHGTPCSNWNIIGDSPLRAQSPLQDYLRTPVGTRKLFEKDKEIKKLKTELEMERYEKSDLNEEIKQHKEKITKLEKKLKETSATVTQLRTELHSKENDSFDTKLLAEMKDTEKTLKSKLNSLEDYSSQLETEQIKLHEKNEKLKEKLEFSNGELKTWKEKAIGFETEHKDILEKYMLQEIEVQNLKVQCGELTNFLDELRSGQCDPCEMKQCSFNISTSEDLGQSVIDVQLRDCRIENADLKKLLAETTEKSRSLEEQMVMVRRNCEETKVNCLESQRKNDELISKIEELTRSHNFLQDLFEKSQGELKNLTNDISEKDTIVTSLQQSLVRSNELNKRFETTNEELKHELCRVEMDFKMNQIVLSEKDNICESLKRESSILQRNYERSVSDFNNLSSEFNVLRKIHDETMEKFSGSLQKLARLCEECKEERFEDKFEMFEVLLENLEKGKLQSEETIKKLTVSLNDSEDVVRNLNAVNEMLKDKLAFNKDERVKIEKMLEASKLYVGELERSLEEKIDDINKVNLKIFELHNTLNELHSLKRVENNCTEENIDFNRIKVLDNILNDIKKAEWDFNEKISMKNQEIDGLNRELSRISEINENLTRESIEKEKSYLEKIFVLESEVKSYTLTVQQLEASNEISEQNLKMKSMEIEELQNGRRTMQENYDRVKFDLEKKITLTKDTQKKLEIEMQIITNEKTSLESNLKKLNDDLAKLDLEKRNLIEQNNLLKQQYSECFENLSKRDREVQDRDDVISDSNKQFLNLKLELELYRQKHKDLQNEMDRVRQEESKYKFCVGTLEDKNREFESKLQQLTYEKDVLKDVRDNLEKKCHDLERNLESIIAQLKDKNENLDDYCHQLALCKSENEKELRNVKEALDEAHCKLEELIVERNDAVQRCDKEISELKVKLNEANCRVYELNSKEIAYIQEIDSIKSDLSSSFEKYAESFSAHQELKMEQEAQIKQLTENLHDVVAKCNRLEQDNKDRTSRLAEIIKEQELLRAEKITLEVKLVNQQKKYNQELETTHEQFQLDLNNLKNKEKTLEQSLTKAMSDLESGRGVQFRLENEVKKLTAKLHGIEQEKEYLQERCQLLEVTKSEVNSEYSQLKLAHEKYISENERDLKARQRILEEEIEKLQKENQKLIHEYFELQKTTDSLRKENENSARNREQIINNLNADVKFMTEKINNLEFLNTTITKEQENLSKNTRKLKLEVDERSEEVEKKNSVISKLQCAYDILQTGKDRVEVDLQNITEAKQKLEEEIIKKEALFNAKLKSYEEKLNNLNEELDKKNTFIVEKDRMLCEKMRELNELHQVYETMTSEKLSLQEQFQQSQQLHKEFLTQIDEENLKTIGDMTFNFMELKIAYQNVHHTLKKLKKEKRKLEKSLEEDNESKKELQAQLEERKQILQEITNKSLNYKEVILEEHMKMQDLLCELHCAISDLEWVKNEKFETEKHEKSTNEKLKDLKLKRDEFFKRKSEFCENKEEEISEIHRQAESLKNELLGKINNVRSDFIATKNIKNQLEEIIEKEKDAKTFLEVKVLNLMNEKMRCEQICAVLYKNINEISKVLLIKPVVTSDFENLSEEAMKCLSEEIEKNIAEVFAKIHEINESIAKLEKERISINAKLSFLENEKISLAMEKNKLFDDYEEINKERCLLKQNNEREKKLLQEEIDGLKSNLDHVDKISKEMENLKTENEVLHQTVQSLKENNVRAYNDYQTFLEVSKNNKNQVDKLLKDRNATETIINNLKQKLLTLQLKFMHLPQEFLYKQYFDQKESLEVIVEDIQRQFNRYSRMSFNVAYNFVMLSEKVIQGIFLEKPVEVEAIFKDLEIDDTQNQIDKLKDLAVDAIEQISTLEKTLDNLEIKSTKPLKENVRPNQVECKAEDEYRKKYISIKHKLTLSENVKNNYEKKLKQLREENKRLSANSKNMDDDTHYKMLVQQVIETKSGYESQIEELKTKQKELENELVVAKNEKNKLEETYQTDIKENYEKTIGTLLEKQNKLDKEILELNCERTKAFAALKSEHAHEIETLREAYGNLMGDKSKLESDYISLKKMYDDRTNQLKEYALIKEAYEKLLEETNQMMTEIDTLKFKRNKDKEEFARLIKKERDDFAAKRESSITQIRTEYENKLELTKQKMLTMYKDEVDKGIQKVQVEKADNTVLLHSLERYKTELEDAKRTIEELKKKNVMTKKSDLMLSQESLGARSVRSECDVRELRTRQVIDCPRSKKRSSIHPVRTVVETRKCATLPKNMDVIEENARSKMVTPADIEMEDEAECFHNKYLADLKDNRCMVSSGRESTSSRMSELAWRNSMVPPHLKSSYPAELQMVTPSRFKEEDIKAGIVDLDDSMSTKLLPPDKGVRKKEQGTTSYKKPGPPTPSKNGGRMSLQGSEVKDPLHDSNDLKTPKRTTPNKIKAFFLGRTSTGRSANTENQPPSPKQVTKLFRKGR